MKQIFQPFIKDNINKLHYMSQGSQCPEFSTIPAVFISGTTTTEVNKGTSLGEVRVATVRICKSNVNGVWVKGEVRHL